MTPDAGDVKRLRYVAGAVAAFVLLLWIVHVAAVVGEWDLRSLGVRPGMVSGLVGVMTAPLVHGSWSHLFSNTLPLLVLGTALVYGTPRAAAIALPVIWLGSGLGVWLFGREAVHIGASGLTHGVMVFVFVAGILRRDRRSIALALLVFFLYGGMIWGVLPLAPGISFESHLFGALAGLACAFLLRACDPLPERPRYSWEDDEDADDPSAEPFFTDRAPDDDEPRP